MDEGIEDLAKSTGTDIRRGAISRFSISSSTAGNFRPSPASGITSRVLVDAVLERAAKFPLLTKYSDLPMEERLLVTPVPEHLGIAVVRLDNHFPPSRQRWLNLLKPTTQAGGMRLSEDPSPVGVPLVEVVMKQVFVDKNLTPFSFETLKERFNFVDLREASDKAETRPSQPASVGESDSAG